MGNLRVSNASSQLRRSLTFPYGVGLAVSTIIGSGLLGLPGIAIEKAGAHVALAGWGMTLLLSIPLMLIFYRLTVLTNNAGGLAHYAEMALGTTARSITTFIIAATFSLCIPIGTIIGCTYIQHIFKLPEAAILPLTIGILCFSTLINMIGVKPSAVINNIAVLALISLITIFVALNIPLLNQGLQLATHIISGNTPIHLYSLWDVSALLFWVYLGWENLSFSSEEFATHPKKIKHIFISAFLIISFLYITLALVSSGAAMNGISVSGITGLLALTQHHPIQPIVYALVVIIVIANVNAWVFAASRLYFAAGRAGNLPRYLATLSPTSIPVASLFTLLIIYLLFSIIILTDLLPLAMGISIANENFIILYMVTIIAFVRIDKTLSGRFLALFAMLSCAFLLSGFGLWLIIPIGFGCAGVLQSYVVNVRKKQLA